MKLQRKGKVSNDVAGSLIGVLAVVFVLVGIVCILIGANLSKPTLQAILINIGCGSVTSGLLSAVLERFTRKISWIANEEAWAEHLADFKEMLSGEDGLTGLLEGEMNRHAREVHVSLTETMKCIYSDRIQRDVFASGLIGAYPMWSGRFPKDFITSQVSLKLMLKDGRTFFKERKQDLKERFRHSAFETRILLLHPDSPFMDAVAHMDDNKIHRSLQQIADCKAAVSTLQEIRQELSTEGIDISTRVQVIGYPLVPTWSGAIGSSLAYVGICFTRPYRGDLNTLVIKRSNDNGVETPLYESFDREYEELWRFAADRSGMSLLDYNLSLPATGPLLGSDGLTS